MKIFSSISKICTATALIGVVAACQTTATPHSSSRVDLPHSQLVAWSAESNGSSYRFEDHAVVLRVAGSSNGKTVSLAGRHPTRNNFSFDIEACDNAGGSIGVFDMDETTDPILVVIANANESCPARAKAVSLGSQIPKISDAGAVSGRWDVVDLNQDGRYELVAYSGSRPADVYSFRQERAYRASAEPRFAVYLGR
jgi:hypothetical protein